MQELGTWGRIDPSRKCKFNRMHVWDTDSPGEIKFNSRTEIATIVENRLLQECLVQTMQQYPTITVYNRDKVESIDLKHKIKGISLTSGQSLSSDLIV